MTETTTKKSISETLRNLPRCNICQQLVLSTTDRSKPSQLVEWMGQSWTETKPTFIPFYPSGEFPKRCDYCERRLNPPRIGKGS